MKRLLATIPLWLIFFIICAPAIPPGLTSITRDAGTGIVITWDGSGGSTFTVARSDESVTNWLAIATGLTDMVYTDAVVSASFAHYRIEEEASGLLELTAIYPSDGTNVVIEWSGNSSNTFSVSRSDMTVTNWTALATNLTSMVYTDTTAVATFAWYRVETQEGGPPVVVADFAGSPTHGAAPLVVTFTNLSSGASEYAWDFGDGNASTNEHPLNTYSNAGSYTVILTAIGAGGSNALTRIGYIVVTNPPPVVVADFAGTPTNGLAPLVVTFTNLSSGATEYAWDFGDGNASTNEHPLNTYSNEGSYTVTLTAMGVDGTNALIRTDYIVVTNRPPIFEDDFEAGGEPGWVEVVYDSISNTLWELGEPSNVGPSGANSGTNLYATNLDSNYGVDSDIGLQTPVIDLSTAESATLEFATYFITEPFWDTVSVFVKDSTGTSDIVPGSIFLDSGTQDNWTTITVAVPEEALGQEVRFEFRFESDFDTVGAGWYIDDVKVSE